MPGHSNLAQPMPRVRLPRMTSPIWLMLNVEPAQHVAFTKVRTRTSWVHAILFPPFSTLTTNNRVECDRFSQDNPGSLPWGVCLCQYVAQDRMRSYMEGRGQFSTFFCDNRDPSSVSVIRNFQLRHTFKASI